MSDIPALVERLMTGSDLVTTGEVVAELTRLAAEIERLREALEPFASHIGKDGSEVVLKIGKDTWTGTLTTEHFAAARAALEAKP